MSPGATKPESDTDLGRFKNLKVSTRSPIKSPLHRHQSLLLQRQSTTKTLATPASERPVWGAGRPRDKAEVESADRIRARNAKRALEAVYKVDPRTLGLNILEKKIKDKEGHNTYASTNEQVYVLKRQLKARE